MDQLKALFQRLSWTQRIWLAVAVVSVVGGLTALSHWNQERDFKPLYSNLAPEDAGALVTKLKEGGIEYRLENEGTTILVPSARIAEARLSMASQGLPKSGRIGFELFDKANLGSSEFAEQVNYHRAIQGELERSVMSIREVEQARVHITFAKESLYTESRQPAKASVLVKLRPGAKLSPQNVAAICQLTASAVPELSPDQVSLVDTSGNLLNRAKRASLDETNASSEATLDYRKSVEKDLQTKIAATLEPILGLDHFRAGVSADVDLTSGEQSEETYDPQKSVMTSSQTSEDGPALPSAAGVPGTASTLPRPTATPAGAANGASNYARKTESVTYQTSRLVRHTKLPQGAIRKLSISVLVDHTLRWEGTKKVIDPPSPEKLKTIHDVVAAAIGFDMDRGDQLVVEAFPFESTLSAEPNTIANAPTPNTPAIPFPLPPWLQKLLGAKNFFLIAGIGAGVLLLLVIGGIVFAIKSGGKKKHALAEQATTAVGSASGQTKEIGPPSPEEMQREMEAKFAEQAALQAKQEAEELMKLKLPAISTKKTEVLTKHISTESRKDPTAMAQVVRSWLNGEQRR
jgi:flagellar M-ring protein FliF